MQPKLKHAGGRPRGEPTESIRLRKETIRAAVDMVSAAVGHRVSAARAIDSVVAEATSGDAFLRVKDRVNAALVAATITAIQAVLVQLTGAHGEVKVSGQRWFVTVPARDGQAFVAGEGEPQAVAVELAKLGAALDLQDTAH